MRVLNGSAQKPRTSKNGIDWDAIHAISTRQEAERRGLKFTKDGPRWVACCPFHNETTPSFTIFPDNGWYCFGCDARGGDAADLTAQLDKVTPTEAARSLLGADYVPPVVDAAEQAKRRSKAAKDRAEHIASLAAYQGDLRKRLIPLDHAAAAPARAYLLKRHLTGYPAESVMFDPKDRAVVGLMQEPDGTVMSLAYTFIDVDGTSRKHKRHRGGQSKGGFVAGPAAPGAALDILVHVEGWENGQAATQARGYAFRAWCGSIPTCAPDPSKLNVICHDVDYNPHDLPDDPAERAKAEARHAKRLAQFSGWQAAGLRVVLAMVEPTPGLPHGYDLNDLLIEDGPDAVGVLVDAAVASLPPPADEAKPDPKLLPIVWIDDIAPVLTARDYVQGVLVEKALTVVYGDSHAGKTFWTTDLALHVAAGKEWNGRRVDQGGVVYCVLEGGDGFKNRVSAWKAANPDFGPMPFAAIPSALNLLDPNASTAILIDTIKAVSELSGFTVSTVVVDTLSRALAGGAENSAEDMGALVINADRIRAETGANLIFIHHSGKDAAKGARGWSGLRAAVDTEIEIVNVETTGSRTATVVKQRDIATVEAIGFRLDTVVLGQNQHGEDVTTCVVTSTDVQAASGRYSEAKLTDKPALMLGALRNLDPKLFEQVVPQAGMSLVSATLRSNLRMTLISQGWFDEDSLVPEANPPKLERNGRVAEHNSLRTLKRRGFINFNQHRIWLTR